MCDEPDPFTGWGIKFTRQITPKAFDSETALLQLIGDGFRRVILEPITIDGYFPICFNDGVLIKPNGFFGVVEALFKH